LIFLSQRRLQNGLHGLKTAIVAEEDIKGPDGEDILKDLEILIQ
jgi:hypothetical protein